MSRNKSRDFATPRKRTAHKSIRTVFQRPDAITQPLDVIVTCFNSARYRTRWKHYEDFMSMAEAAGSAVRVWTVEIAFGDREFAITDPHNERHLQLRTSSELWHKERSQNLLVQRVIARHPHAEYFAFVDADISFIRHDWADEARHALQHYDVVQMWQEAYDLDASGSVIHRHHGFAACHANGAPVPSDNEDYYYAPGRGGITYWHPGYAWAWRRRALEGVGGLIDWAVLGSADFHMAHALVGTVESTLKRKLGARYARGMREWQGRALASIKRNIGFMPGSIFHHFHGPKAARRYKDRWKILEQTKFDQFRDLVADVQGLYRFQHHGHERSNLLRDLTRRYFHERNEDAS
jgi:hypothetical protein